MKVTSWHSERDRCDIVELQISDVDRATMINSREIVRDVREKISAAIAAKIMEKLGPAIDKLLAGEYDRIDTSATWTGTAVP